MGKQGRTYPPHLNPFLWGTLATRGTRGIRGYLGYGARGTQKRGVRMPPPGGTPMHVALEAERGLHAPPRPGRGGSEKATTPL